MTAPEVKVTQADRDAAADAIATDAQIGMKGAVRRGDYDGSEAVKAFARHRQSATAPLEARIALLEGALGEELAKYDAVVKACPANKTFLGDKKCPKCGAGPDEGCREENRAAYSFISNARTTLARLSAMLEGGDT